MCISEPIHFSDTSCRLEAMPRIGQDNDYVYGSLLGLSADEMEAVRDGGECWSEGRVPALGRKPGLLNALDTDSSCALCSRKMIGGVA